MKTIIARIRGYLFILKCRYMRKNVSIGIGFKMYCKLEIQGKGTVLICKNCIVSGVSGDNRHYVTLDTFRPTANISIGDNAMLFAARISSKFSVTIGDSFLIEESGITDTDFHSITPDRREPSESAEKCQIKIGNRVSVGSRSIICKGVKVGDDVVIYPGTIVNKDVPPGSVVCGNPVRLIKKDIAV